MKLRITYALLFFILLLVIWQFIVTLFNVNSTLYPSPVDVFYSFFESKDLLIDSLVSIARLLVGAFVGILLGIAFGLSSGKSELINDSFGSVANFLRFIPPLALVPLFLIWFGIGEFSKVSLLAWTAFFPVWISTFNGVKDIDKDYLLVAKSLGVKKIFLLKEIVFKGSLPYILNGARIGIGIAFSVLVAAEMLGAYVGIGYRISFLQSVYRVDRMLGYIIVLGIIGLIIDRGFLLFSKKLTPWKNED